MFKNWAKVLACLVVCLFGVGAIAVGYIVSHNQWTVTEMPVVIPQNYAVTIVNFSDLSGVMVEMGGEFPFAIEVDGEEAESVTVPPPFGTNTYSHYLLMPLNYSTFTTASGSPVMEVTAVVGEPIIVATAQTEQLAGIASIFYVCGTLLVAIALAALYTW